MALKYNLIPISRLTTETEKEGVQNVKRDSSHDSSAEVQNIQHSATEIKPIYTQSAELDHDSLNPDRKDDQLPSDNSPKTVLGENSLVSISAMLPHKYRNKAERLLRQIDGHISLDKNLRVIYADGTLGSSLIDLIRYYLYPRSSRLQRPLDSLDFGILLKKLDVRDESSQPRQLVLKRYRRLHKSKPSRTNAKQDEPARATANKRIKWNHL